MPDLSNRPTRYAVTAVALAAAVGVAASTFQVRVGPDAALAAAKARSHRLSHEVTDLRRQVTRQANQLAATNARVVSATPNCARYPNQESAQIAFTSDPTGLAALDGDHDGVACEQLKSAATALTTRAAPTKATNEPSAPAQEETPPVNASRPTAPSKAEIVASGHHFGMYTATSEEFGDLELSLARDATMRGYYKGWDTPFDTNSVVSSWQRGEVPVMTWESRSLATTGDTTDYSLRRIIDGDFDQYLTTYAHDIVALGLPIVVRFDHEMNGNWYRWTEFDSPYGNAKGDYIAAWRHVHDVFQAQGANSLVVWLWSPNRVDNLTRFPSIDNYYPGRDYVDWVGMTGYYRPGDGTATFSATYDKTLAELHRVAPGVPILLSEVGATDTGGKKVDWVNSFFTGIATHPDVVGFLWFNYAVTQDGETNDWRLDSTPDVFSAFSAGLSASSYGRLPGKSPVLVPLATGAQTAAPPPSTAPASTTTTRPPATTTTRPAGTTTTTRPPSTTPTTTAP
jgi:hypothetical protein